LGLFHSSNLSEQRHRLIIVEGLVRAVSQRPEPDLRVATLQAQLQAVYTSWPLGVGSGVDLDRLCRLHNGPRGPGLAVRELLPHPGHVVPDALGVQPCSRAPGRGSRAVLPVAANRGFTAVQFWREGYLIQRDPLLAFVVLDGFADDAADMH